MTVRQLVKIDLKAWALTSCIGSVKSGPRSMSISISISMSMVARVVETSMVMYTNGGL